MIPWLGVLACWLWVRRSPLLAASSNLVIFVAAVAAGTAIVVALDASALRFGQTAGRAPKARGPVGTFIGVLLLWPILFPMHIRDRRTPGLPVRLAILGTLAFVISVALVAVAIDDKREEMARGLKVVWP